jgi:hypothetical protein
MRLGLGAALVAAVFGLSVSAASASKGKVPHFTIVYSGGGSGDYSDHATFPDAFGTCGGFTGYSTESDSALLKWTVTWKHVILKRHNFVVDGGKSTFHAGVGGDLSHQVCDSTTGQPGPAVHTTCGTTGTAAGPVTLEAKYYNRGQVNALLPGKKSSSFEFEVAAADNVKTKTTGPEDCATTFAGDAFAFAGFFTNALKNVNHASKRVTEASRRGGSPDPIDCSAPSIPTQIDHCQANIHFKASVKIIRER